MDFSAEKCLADSEALADGDTCHPYIDAETRNIRFPNVLVEKKRSESSRKTEVSSDWLADTFSVQCAGQWMDDAVGDRSIEFMPQVERRDIVKMPVKHGTYQQFNPFGCNAS